MVWCTFDHYLLKGAISVIIYFVFNYLLLRLLLYPWPISRQREGWGKGAKSACMRQTLCFVDSTLTSHLVWKQANQLFEQGKSSRKSLLSLELAHVNNFFSVTIFFIYKCDAFYGFPFTFFKNW